jgi:hypothetical protein
VHSAAFFFLKKKSGDWLPEERAIINTALNMGVNSGGYV